jgi:hypothetical protein
MRVTFVYLIFNEYAVIVKPLQTNKLESCKNRTLD